MAFNKVILIGNLVADPELKTTQSGISVVSFRIAVNRSYVKQGEQPQTDFIDVVAWRGTAEFIAKWFAKGKQILVCGELQTRSWEDKEGKKRWTVEVVANEATFVGKKDDGGGSNFNDNSPYSPYSSPNNNNTDYEPKFEEASSDDDLPF